MTSSPSTTIERLAPELIAVVADDLRVLNDRAADGRPGGGDVDCAVRGVRRAWPLRLREWQLSQAFWYDVTATYYVLERSGELLALDVVDDPKGIGKYRFPTGAFSTPGPAGSLAPEPDRAAYLTLKRIFKRDTDPSSWDEIGALATHDSNVFRDVLAGALGVKAADEIVNVLDAGGAPDAATLERWRRQLRRHRGLGVELVRARLWAGRVLHRIAHPTGFVVAVVGPDGSGKSTLARSLPSACGQLFRRSLAIHFRPGVLPRPGAVVGAPASDPTRPHARPPHGRLVSLLLLGYYWLDFELGQLVKIAPARRRAGIVVLERGFRDLAVDPQRYRLNVSPRLVQALSRALPAPDLTVVLEAGVDAIAARKAELPPAEIARQSEMWRTLPVGGDAVSVSSAQPRDLVLAEVRSHIMRRLQDRIATRLDGGWAALPTRRNPRYYFPRRSRSAGLGGLALLTPSKRTSRMVAKALRALVSAGVLRAFPPAAPPSEVRRAVAASVPAGGTVAVRRTVHRERHAAAILDAGGTPVTLAKVATDDLGRARLRAERRAIERWSLVLASPLRGPRIVSADEGVLVFEWIPHELRPRPWFLPADIAGALGALFAAGATEGPDGPRGPAHGDAAPWNFLSSGETWYLVDWEVSVDDAPPFFDVFHYLVQAHTFLGHPKRGELLQGLRGHGWVGDALGAYAASAGVPLELVPASFRRYLEHTSTPGTMRDMSFEAVQLRRELIALVSA